MVSKHEKMIEEISQMSVLDLADLVKAIEEKFGVSAAVQFAAAGPAQAEAAEKPEEKAEYKVTLQDGGSEKIKVIKVLRTFWPNLALTEAKKMADSAPCVIAEAVAKDEAAKIKKELEAVGAKVELA